MVLFVICKLFLYQPAMKLLQRFSLLAILLALMVSCGQQSAKQDEYKHKTGSPIPDAEGFYGLKFEIVDITPAYKIPEALSNANGVELVVNGSILDVCQMSGCWLEMDMMNGESIFVTFKNDSFVIPMDRIGSDVTIKGFANKESVGVEMLKRIAADEGKSEEEIAAISQPEEEYSFVASGLIFQ